jgi:hypothetical protein
VSGPALIELAKRRLDRTFSGEVGGAIYDLLRVVIAAIFVVRHSDWLRPVLFLEHHRFVRGLLFLDGGTTEPRLSSPLLLGFSLSPGLNDALVYLRTALSLGLLLGIRVPIVAGGLAMVSYVLLAADRYRYYHHLFLLYVVVACLALCPSPTRFSAEYALRRGALPQAWPAWPLQLIRALVMSVYLAAGVSKLNAPWLRGETLADLARLDLTRGAAFELAERWIGFAGIAQLSCATELALPLLLALPATRRAGVLLAWAFHLGISLSMPVYSFGAQMAVLVLAFWPRVSDERGLKA